MRHAVPAQLCGLRKDVSEEARRVAHLCRVQPHAADELAVRQRLLERGGCRLGALIPKQAHDEGGCQAVAGGRLCHRTLQAREER